MEKRIAMTQPIYRAVSIDDEHKIRQVLRIKVERHCPLIQWVGEADGVESGHELIQREKPDIVFLDISMGDGTGFDFLKNHIDPDFEVIFITGYGEHAIEALRANAVDYLMKPIQTEELIIAVSNAVKRRLKRIKTPKSTPQESNRSKRIVVSSEEGMEFVWEDDITHVEGWEKYTRIHRTSGPVLLSSYNIGHYRAQLNEQEFFQVHKSHLVHRNHISGYLNQGYVLLKGGDQVPVSRRKRQAFLEWIQA